MIRHKERYEKKSRSYLQRGVPVILRLDGKAFHTYTRGLDKPFDEGLIEDMQLTAIHLCENIQGAKCAYTQSDEINIMLTDYDRFNTDAYFDYQIQKVCGVAASMAASKFNQLRMIRECIWDNSDTNGQDYCNINPEWHNLPLANFDCRAFNVPVHEVANNFLARQRDAVKNSIAMLAQSLYSHNELHKKNGSEMQDMCFEKGHNWNDLHFSKKRGSWIVKNEYWNDLLVKSDAGKFRYTGLLFENNTEDTLSHNTAEKGVVSKKDVKIRTKWEVEETPMKFENKHFEQWLTPPSK